MTTTAPPEVELVYVPLDCIIEHEDNVRGYFDDAGIKELADSIFENGLITPIALHSNNDESFQLLAGARRFRAMQLLVEQKRWKKDTDVPAMLRAAVDVGTAKVTMLVENCQRVDISPFDEAKAYRSLIDEHGFTQRALATKVGKASGHITKRLSLLTLDPRLEVVVAAGGLTLDQAYELSQCDQADADKIAKRLVSGAIAGHNLQWEIDGALRAKRDKAESVKFVAALAKLMIETVPDFPGTRGDYRFIGNYSLDNLAEYTPKRGDVVLTSGKFPTRINVHRKETAAEKKKREAKLERNQAAAEAEYEANRTPWEAWRDEEDAKDAAFEEQQETYRDALNSALASYLTDVAPKEIGKIGLALAATMAVNRAEQSCRRLGINPITTNEDGTERQYWQFNYAEPLTEWIGDDTGRAVAAWIAGYADHVVVDTLDVFAPLRANLETQGIVAPVEPDPAPEPWYDETTDSWSTEPQPEDNQESLCHCGEPTTEGWEHGVEACVMLTDDGDVVDDEAEEAA